MRGAIFDMDGLLLDSERLYQQCWRDLAKEHGIILPDSFPMEITGSGADRTRIILRKYFPGADPDALITDCKERVTLLEETDLAPMPGAAELLHYLQEMNWLLAVASSSPRDMVLRNLERTGLSVYFRQVLSGEDIVRGKPFPDIFLLAAERLGVAPQDCLVLEDSPNGLLAARAAGCRPVMVPDQVPPTDELLSFCLVYPSLTDVMNAVRSGKLQRTG
jgi:HAD superfamily hydrolase (TIGR01509 family)